MVVWSLTLVQELNVKVVLKGHRIERMGNGTLKKPEIEQLLRSLRHFVTSYTMKTRNRTSLRPSTSFLSCKGKCLPRAPERSSGSKL